MNTIPRVNPRLRGATNSEVWAGIALYWQKLARQRDQLVGARIEWNRRFQAAGIRAKAEHRREQGS